MRILQLTSGLSLSDGGPTEVMIRINEAFNDLGHHAVLLGTDAVGLRGHLSPEEREQIGDPETVHLHRVHPPRLLKASLGLARETLRTAKAYEIAHVHGLYLAHDIAAWLARRSAGGPPYVIQAHGVLEPYQRSQSATRKRMFDTLIGRRIIRGASGFVFAADSERQRARTVLPRDARTCVVPLGSTAPAEPLVRKASDDAHFLFLGRLARKKQPDLLVRAWAEMNHPTARLTVAGPDGEFSSEELKSLARQLNAPPTIDFVPMITGAAKSSLLASADVFVLPSQNENFGVAVAEALRHGAAVLTTNAVASSEHVRLAGAGRIIPLNELTSTVLAGAMEAYANDAGRTRAEGDAGVVYASENLTWTATARRLTDFYDEVIANEPR